MGMAEIFHMKWSSSHLEFLGDGANPRTFWGMIFMMHLLIFKYLISKIRMG